MLVGWRSIFSSRSEKWHLLPALPAGRLRHLLIIFVIYYFIFHENILEVNITGVCSQNDGHVIFYYGINYTPDYFFCIVSTFSKSIMLTTDGSASITFSIVATMSHPKSTNTMPTSVFEKMPCACSILPISPNAVTYKNPA